MHCALAGIPGAITYRTDALTYWLGRMLVKVEYLGIANLILGEPMYPEFIQGAATPESLAAELRSSLSDAARRQKTAEQATRLREALRGPMATTTAGAAEWLARQL
jgi:lipid-A-disaccharide synthase